MGRDYIERDRVEDERGVCGYSCPVSEILPESWSLVAGIVVALSCLYAVSLPVAMFNGSSSWSEAGGEGCGCTRSVKLMQEADGWRRAKKKVVFKCFHSRPAQILCTSRIDTNCQYNSYSAGSAHPCVEAEPWGKYDFLRLEEAQHLSCQILKCVKQFSKVLFKDL